MSGKSTKEFLLLSVAGFLVMSASLMLMPVQGLGVLPGIAFWAGLLAGAAGQLLLHRALRRELGRHGRFGLIAFFANKWAKAADIGLAVSLPVTVLMLSVDGVAYGCYVALASTVFFFCMHCVLNGRTFGHVMGHDRTIQIEKGDGTR